MCLQPISPHGPDADLQGPAAGCHLLPGLLRTPTLHAPLVPKEGSFLEENVGLLRIRKIGVGEALGMGGPLH